MISLKINTISGKQVIGDKFDSNDYNELIDVLKGLVHTNQRLKSLGGRGLNIPDIVSEGIFCYNYNAIRTNANGGSQDAVIINTGDEVQIKSTSISNDLTSFGPESTWTKLYLMDFVPNGNIDGTVDIYLITTDVKKEILNKSKNETFEDQQKQGRRPRLSLKQIISRDNIPVDKRIKLW